MADTPDIDKRTAILNTTLDLIAEHGFHGTPMSQVAKRSGVSIGIIYHYFEGKDELIIELYRHVKYLFGQALMQGDPLEMPFPGSVKQIWLNAFHFSASNPRATYFLEQFENSPYQKAWDETDLNENMQILADMMQQKFEDGAIRPMSFEVLYELTLGVAIGLAKRQINGSIQLDDATLNWIAESCCRAIANT